MLIFFVTHEPLLRRSRTVTITMLSWLMNGWSWYLEVIKDTIMLGRTALACWVWYGYVTKRRETDGKNLGWPSILPTLAYQGEMVFSFEWVQVIWLPQSSRMLLASITKGSSQWSEMAKRFDRLPSICQYRPGPSRWSYSGSRSVVPTAIEFLLSLHFLAVTAHPTVDKV